MSWPTFNESLSLAIIQLVISLIAVTEWLGESWAICPMGNSPYCASLGLSNCRFTVCHWVMIMLLSRTPMVQMLLHLIA